MSKIQTNELTGPALDWAVAKCDAGGWTSYPDNPIDRPTSYTFRPSTDWAQGGPIIEREKITVFPFDNEWAAAGSCCERGRDSDGKKVVVDVPDELMQKAT